MKPILTSEMSRASDISAQQMNVAVETLINNAATALFNACISYPHHDDIAVICGKGNNGADGFFLAKKLIDAGIKTHIIIPLGISNLSPNTRKAAANIPLRYMTDAYDDEIAQRTVSQADITVDCLFGTGFHGELDERVGKLFSFISQSKSYVICADVPSGINCDTGKVANGTLKADETVVFSTWKPYCFLYPARDFAGKMQLCDVGVPDKAINNQKPYLFALDDSVMALIPKTHQNAHKGTQGTVQIICGSKYTPGAAAMCTDAALHSGAGLVCVSAPSYVRKIMQSRFSEPVYTKRLKTTKANAFVIGCGLGKATGRCLGYYLYKNIPSVIDADALTYIASHPNILKRTSSVNVFTPHPLEMSRLTNKSVEEIEADRIKTAIDFSATHNAITVLKGHFTVIALPDGKAFINTTGNAGLAKGGSGDVLAGLIGGLIARGCAPAAAAIIGVYIHGKAADNIADKYSKTYLQPSMLPNEISKLI